MLRTERLPAVAALGLVLGVAACSLTAAIAQPVPYPAIFVPGTKSEQDLVARSSGSTVVTGQRVVATGGFLVYALSVRPGALARLELRLNHGSQLPDVSPRNLTGGGIPVSRLQSTDAIIIDWHVDARWPAGRRMEVVVRARTGPVNVTEVRVTVVPAEEGGLPVTVRRLMTEGLSARVAPTVARMGRRPYTITQTGQPSSPAIDLQSDAVFAYSADSSVIASWKSRGYEVWTMGGARAGKEFAASHPEAVQTTATGKQLAIGDSYYVTPTADRSAAEWQYYRASVTAGSGGVCPEEPEYWAAAGFEGAFRDAWHSQFGSSWTPPNSSIEARWRASELMARLETDHIDAILDRCATEFPRARRMVAFHSPLNYADWRIVCPQYAISRLPAVQDIVGQVWTDTARTPARYAGIMSDRTFATAFLEYSSLYNLVRGTGKRLWFLMDPLGDDVHMGTAAYARDYEKTLIASLLFPDVDAYEVMPWPERVYGRIPADYGTEINSAIAALQRMHTQTATGRLRGDDIGVLISDSMQWQRADPSPSDLDGLFGLALPLLSRGVAVQLASLDRAAEPGYLAPYRTLILSYDFQKPPSANAQQALADWVQHGGSLLFIGGSDPYNSVPDAWWQTAKLDAPQLDLWRRLGLDVGTHTVAVLAPAANAATFKTAVSVKTGAADAFTPFTVDLTGACARTGCALVRVSSSVGAGVDVRSVQVRLGGALGLAFLTGTEVESRFLVEDHGSDCTAQGTRHATGTASWTYRFDNLPTTGSVSLTMVMRGSGDVAVAAGSASYVHTLIGTAAGDPVIGVFPRMRVPEAYAVTEYAPRTSVPASLPAVRPAPVAQSSGIQGAAGAAVSPLYVLRSGGTPVWMATVGRGLVECVGVPPALFSSSQRAADMLRALTQYAEQHAGGVYEESPALRLERGRFQVIRSLTSPVLVPGSTIDVLSPDLGLATDRSVAANSLALLYAVSGPGAGEPRIGFVSGRVVATLETAQRTAFYARAPEGTIGAARVLCGRRGLLGAKAFDEWGRAVPLRVDRAGDTLLLRYPNEPDGIVVRIGWNPRPSARVTR